MSPSRTENGVYKELPFFCTLRESFCFSTPTWGRPRWPAKNKSDQWKLKSNEITSESFVLLKYFQYCCSDDGWLFPFPIYFPSPSLGFITLGNVHGMARKKEMQQVHSPLQCQDNFYLSRFSVGFFMTGLCKASSLNRSGSVLLQFFLLSTGAQHPQTQQGTSSLLSAPLVAACSSEYVVYSWNSSPPPQFFLIICPLFQPDGDAFPFTFSWVSNKYGFCFQSQICLGDLSAAVPVVPWICTILPSCLFSSSQLIVMLWHCIVLCRIYEIVWGFMFLPSLDFWTQIQSVALPKFSFYLPQLSSAVQGFQLKVQLIPVLLGCLLFSFSNVLFHYFQYI